MLARVSSPLLALAGVVLAAVVQTPGQSFAEELPRLVAPVPAAPVSPPNHAVAIAPTVPAWLLAHVGDADGQISAFVLQRARAFYLQKVREGAVDNPCYFAF